jgi:hypothetical protein
MKPWLYSFLIIIFLIFPSLAALAEESSAYADLQGFVNKSNYKFPIVIDKVTSLTSVLAKNDLSLEYNYQLNTDKLYKSLALDAKKARAKSKTF